MNWEEVKHVSGQDSNLSGVVTVTMAESLAIYFFGSKLSEFAASDPDIEVHIFSTTDVLDISRRETDIAIRFDNNPPQSLVGKRLFP